MNNQVALCFHCERARIRSTRRGTSQHVCRPVKSLRTLLLGKGDVIVVALDRRATLRVLCQSAENVMHGRIAQNNRASTLSALCQ